MALRGGTIWWRVLALGASAGVHAAVLLTPIDAPVGAPIQRPLSAIAPVEPPWTEIDVEPPPAPPETTPLPNRATPEPSAAPPRAPEVARKVAPSPPAPPASSHVEPSTLTVDTGALPRFTIAISAGAPGAQGPAPTAGAPRADARDADREEPLSEQAVDTPASLVRSEVPSYPTEARAAGIEADVKLELVVSREGAVESVRGLQRAGYGLDEAAIAAARTFRFRPAMKHGQPVRVRVSWNVEFRLQ